jgi:5-methylcytosine-specific restriction endonuclease McrA
LKNCYVCKTDKASDQFGKNRRYDDGLQRVCKTCWTARAAAYRAENIEQVRAIERGSKAKRWNEDSRFLVRQRAYNRTHREQIRKTQTARYARDPERFRKAMREWRAAHPEACWIQDTRKRLVRAKATGHATEQQVRDRMAVWGFRCWACSAPMESVDHVIPLSRGGTNWPANLRPCCLSCNSSKGAKDWKRWIAEKRTAL